MQNSPKNKENKFFMPTYTIVPLTRHLGLLEFCNFEKFDSVIAPYFRKYKLL